MSDIEYTEAAAPADITTPRFGDPVEHRIVRQLIRGLKAEGFNVHSVAVDRELYIKTTTERAALCEVFEYDAYVTLRFMQGNDESELFGVMLVAGNGEDIVSDWTDDSGESQFSATISKVLGLEG
jgi:hypothetical protein